MQTHTPYAAKHWPKRLLLPLVLWGVFLCSFTQAEEKPIKIGVLAVRGLAQCLKNWSPTADYLTRQIPGYTFVIVPLNHDAITPSVVNGEVDFILSNSSYYVELEQGYGVTRIATLKEMRLGRVYSHYGGVIFSRGPEGYKNAGRSQGKVVYARLGKFPGRLADGLAGTQRKRHKPLKGFQGIIA